MFQRKQTLFLFLGAIMALFSFVWPEVSYTVSNSDVLYEYTTRGVTASGMPVTDFDLKMPVWAFYLLIAGVLVVATFLFKNRPRQIRVVRSTYLIAGLTAFAAFSQHLSIMAYLGKERHIEAHFGAAMFLPLGIIVCVVLALQGIRKDEELVKSADRLR